MVSRNPGLDCIMGKHLFAEAVDPDDPDAVVASWCLWDGGAVYDGDRVTEDGQPIGWPPTYRVRVPDGWYRRPEDVLGSPPW